MKNRTVRDMAIALGTAVVVAAGFWVAAPILAFGAVGSVPAGNGIVEGDEIPYLPDAAKKQKDNEANWLDRDPEIKCYLPGIPRANYMAMPFQILHSDK